MPRRGGGRRGADGTASGVLPYPTLALALALGLGLASARAQEGEPPPQGLAAAGSRGGAARAAPAGSSGGGPAEEGWPQQLLLTAAPGPGDAGALGVSFASNFTGGSPPEAAGVYYWDRAAGPGARRFAAARTTRYVHQGAPDAWAGGRQNFTPYVSMWQHHARLTGVEPGTTLVYAAYTGAGGREGAPVEVAVPPRASAYGGDPAQGFTLGVVGDLGQTEHSATTVEHLMRCDHAAVLLVGDLSYADKENARWDSWRDFVQPYFDHEPLLSLPGNHEIETDVAGESFRPYAHRFQMMPHCGAGAGGGCGGGYLRRNDATGDDWSANMWFSVDIGSAHILHISSYHDTQVTSEQYEWILQDLKKVDRAKTPWLLVNMHAPWYNSNVAHQEEIESLGPKHDLEHLLFRFGVNIVFAGHVHAYERNHPTYKDHRHPRGPTYINIGDGGNREGIYDRWLPGPDGEPTPEWSAFRAGSYGHGLIQFFNATHAEWTWHRNQDPHWEVKDSTVIENHFGAEPAPAADGPGRGGWGPHASRRCREEVCPSEGAAAEAAGISRKGLLALQASVAFLTLVVVGLCAVVAVLVHKLRNRSRAYVRAMELDSDPFRLSDDF